MSLSTMRRIDFLLILSVSILTVLLKERSSFGIATLNLPGFCARRWHVPQLLRMCSNLLRSIGVAFSGAPRCIRLTSLSVLG